MIPFGSHVRQDGHTDAQLWSKICKTIAGFKYNFCLQLQYPFYESTLSFILIRLQALNKANHIWNHSRTKVKKNKSEKAEEWQLKSEWGASSKAKSLRERIKMFRKVLQERHSYYRGEISLKSINLLTKAINLLITSVVARFLQSTVDSEVCLVTLPD